MAFGGCTLDKQSTPALSGPSTFGLSLAITATPDVLSQDGQSQASIDVIARDGNSQPIPGLTLRANTSVAGTVVDFGTLLSRTASTNSAGHATFIYTAPPAPPPTAPDSTVVTFVITPVDSNYQNTTTAGHTVAIQLVRPGVILGPSPTITPAFVFSPTSPKEGDQVNFDGSSSSPAATIVGYSWSFGDGGTGSGVKTTHAYQLAGQFSIVLTVTDNRGNQVASAPQTINVGVNNPPVPAFAVSPAIPVAGTPAYFNASGSKAADGHQIVSYSWDFGDGTTGSGAVIQHTYQLSGTYNVTLNCTDDAGHVGSLTQSVTIATSNPTASFTNTTQVNIGDPITFDGSGSTVAIQGRTIVSYQWDFGDNGATASGVTVTHTFSVNSKSYTVTLKVTDSAGQIGTTARVIQVK